MTDNQRAELKSLKTIIDTPGEYETRYGLRVKISGIASDPNHMFLCMGELFKSPSANPHWSSIKMETWHTSGRISATGPNSYDVVRKICETKY